MEQPREWYAIREGSKWVNYGYCPDTGKYHWEKDINYAGYTAAELIEMGAE